MSKVASYNVNLLDLGADAVTLEWQVGKPFFETLDQDLVSDGLVDVTLRIQKKTASYEVSLHIEGQVTIPCDRCLEPMQQDVSGDMDLKVQEGDEFCDDGQIITIPADMNTLDFAWNIYECIALAIPISHTHPEGQCDSAMTALLNEHTASSTGDPRWEKLRELTVDN
ncbi:MAG: DUF177 domain-containing protein [Bacteroidaceae bacterium]|nr:DUF177 domain-containing protein [Bacteroidaceae bacterium]MBR4242815.1 DUF177 domain-containing protein [Bacteroidaceae bacterium]